MLETFRQSDRVVCVQSMALVLGRDAISRKDHEPMPKAHATCADIGSMGSLARGSSVPQPLWTGDESVSASHEQCTVSRSLAEVAPNDQEDRARG